MHGTTSTGIPSHLTPNSHLCAPVRNKIAGLKKKKMILFVKEVPTSCEIGL